MTRLLPRQTSDEPSETEILTDVGEAIASNSARDWLWAALIMLVAVVASRIARMLLTRVVERTGSSAFLSDFLGRILGYVVVVFGLVYALEEVGVQITPLLGALGLVGIAIAFALQSILENFVAGVLLQTRRPFEKGDEIESQDHVGVIMSVDSRTLTLRTPSGEVVRLPNGEVIKNPIVNFSETGMRRTSLAVGVAYGTNLSAAVDVAEAALRSVPDVEADPPPTVLVTAFGESSIDLEALFWHGPTIAEKLKARHAVAIAVANAFDDANITIPFPQRTLHLRSVAAEPLRIETAPREPHP